MPFHTVSEELRLGTDNQTLLRTFSFVREATDSAPREEVFALCELPDKPAGGEDIIRSVFNALKEVCFLNQGADPYERFETALKEVNAVLSESRERTPNKNIGPANAVIGFLSGRDLHITQSGEAEAYLIRRGTLTTMTEGLTPDDNAVDHFVNIASGKVDNHDKILLASERLLRYATKNELPKIFSPNKEIALSLEELDEIIVLEGAQTTGIFALDIVTEAVATRATTATESMLAPENKFTELTGQLARHTNRGLNWLRDKLPEGTRLPGLNRTNNMLGGGELAVDRNYVILGFLVVVILIILSISWSLGGKRGSVKLEEVRAVLTDVQFNIDVATRDRNIGNKAGAYEALNKASASLDDLVKSGLALEEATMKLDEVSDLRDQLDNIRRYRELTPVADIGAKESQVSLIGLEDYHGRRVAYDTHKLYETTLDQVADAVELDAVSTIRTGSYFSDRDALIFLTTDGKIIEWRDGDVKTMDTEDEVWKSGIAIGTYAKFIYLLDPTNNQIWKYARKSDRYSTAEGYNENADLTKSVSITIDGDIWVLTNDNDGDMNNDIIRIRRGKKKALVIKDLPGEIWNNPRKIYTDENLRYVYVLDQDNKRILRFYKNPEEAGSEERGLEYERQYLFEGLDEVRDFWVNDSEQKIFVIDSQKIYEVDT